MNNLDKLAPALVALQADLTPVAKSATNPFFKSSYAPLPEVMEAVQPLLAKHKLAISQFLSNIEGQSAMRTILLHESGQYIEDIQPLLLVKQDPQSQGSATTYARRYGVMSVLGVVADEDDDGNRASKATQKVERTANTDLSTSGAEQEILVRAKDAINKELESQGYTRPDTKKAFIFKVLKKETIDTIDDAELVDDQLANEKDV
jgi:hypothetical protein